MADPIDVEVDGIDSVRGELDGLLSASGGSTWAVGSDVRYAVYVERGTMYTPAQPYLEPAIQTVMGSTADTIAANAGDVDEIVEQLAKAIAEEAQDNAPVDTGKLQASITAEKLD